MTEDRKRFRQNERGGTIEQYQTRMRDRNMILVIGSQANSYTRKTPA